MERRAAPLLAELHAHTTWSDGEFAIQQLVDIYGVAGFDLLCVTDHVYRTDDPCVERSGRRAVDESSFRAYVAEVDDAAARAWDRYRLLVVAGVELSYNAVDPHRSAHAVAVGLREFVSLDDGLPNALERAAAAGAALIGAHPDDGLETTRRRRATLGFATDPDGLGALVHRYELFNRSQLFSWIAGSGRPSVAAGDFHRLEHLDGWKTLIPCAPSEAAVVAYLRSARPVYLARFDVATSRAAA